MRIIYTCSFAYDKTEQKIRAADRACREKYVKTGGCREIVLVKIFEKVYFFPIDLLAIPLSI